MQILLIAAIVILNSFFTTWAAEPELLPRLDSNNPDALREEVRFLTDEIKLAARPQTYVVIDLADNAVLIKARGIILHRLPVEQWSLIPLNSATAIYRLLERPPVSRRKTDPAFATGQAPISLDDMPTEFLLRLAPPLSVRVRSSSGNLLDTLAHSWYRLWIRITNWARVPAAGHASPDDPTVLLFLAPDQAKSLAWSVTEGMPFLIRRASLPSSQP